MWGGSLYTAASALVHLPSSLRLLNLGAGMKALQLKQKQSWLLCNGREPPESQAAILRQGFVLCYAIMCCNACTAASLGHRSSLTLKFELW